MSAIMGYSKVKNEIILANQGDLEAIGFFAILERADYLGDLQSVNHYSQKYGISRNRIRRLMAIWQGTRAVSMLEQVEDSLATVDNNNNPEQEQGVAFSPEERSDSHRTVNGQSSVSPSLSKKRKEKNTTHIMSNPSSKTSELDDRITALWPKLVRLVGAEGKRWLAVPQAAQVKVLKARIRECDAIKKASPEAQSAEELIEMAVKVYCKKWSNGRSKGNDFDFGQYCSINSICNPTNFTKNVDACPQAAINQPADSYEAYLALRDRLDAEENKNGGFTQ